MTPPLDSGTSPRDVAWLLDRFVAGTPGVAQVIGVSADGLLMAASAPIRRQDADRLAAIISGLTSLTLGAAALLDRGPLRQVIVDYARGYLLVSTIAAEPVWGSSRTQTVTSAWSGMSRSSWSTGSVPCSLPTPSLICERACRYDRGGRPAGPGREEPGPALPGRAAEPPTSPIRWTASSPTRALTARHDPICSPAAALDPRSPILPWRPS
jgi:predicted regulator of Ras-like GTPase activity (Roadblock/LC7/MglB family)